MKLLLKILVVAVLCEKVGMCCEWACACELHYVFLYAELMQILGMPNEKKCTHPQNAISHAFLIIKAIGLTTALYIIIKFCQHAFKAL